MYYNNTLKINTSYSYDVLNRMSQVSGNNQTVSYEYNNSDQLIKTTAIDTQTNTVSESINEYVCHEKMFQTEKINGQTIIAYTIYHMTDGTVGRVDTQSNISAIPSTAVSYEYDDMGRLTKEIQQSSGKSLTTDYTYDRNQNRTGKTDTLWNNGTTSITQTSYTYDINNHMLTESTASGTKTDVNQYTYDSNGNLAQVKQNNSVWKTIQYDLFNRPSRFVEFEIDYFYDGNGKRLKKRVLFCEDEDYVYDGENMVMSTRPYDEQIMFRGLSLIARKNIFDWGQGMDADYLEYYHLNPHGDVQFTSNTDGTIANTYAYDGFGNQLSTTSSNLPFNMDTNAFRYCGEYLDQDTGYIYLRARDYDPTTGRFITEDPAKDGVNWYTYCYNSPISYIDPSGNYASYHEVDYFLNENPGLYDQLIQSNPDDYWAVIDEMIERERVPSLDYISEEEAAIAFLTTFMERSYIENREYGVSIYWVEIDGIKYFRWSKIKYGNSDQVALVDAPMNNITRISFAHTHARNRSGLSIEDIKTADFRNIIVYSMSQYGEIYKYRPRTLEDTFYDYYLSTNQYRENQISGNYIPIKIRDYYNNLNCCPEHNCYRYKCINKNHTTVTFRQK